MIETRLAEYVAVLNASDPARHVFTVERGRKYAKVVQCSGGVSRSVHGFVEIATGAVLKPEGWAKPAKGVRYSLTDDASFADLLAAAAAPQAFCGAYLYY